jgi:hypothetical protein
VPSPSLDRYSGPSTPLVDDLVFAFVSAPQGPPVAVARGNSEEATGWAESFAITSMGLGSESGFAVVELGDAISALGVVPICIGWDSGCGISLQVQASLQPRAACFPIEAASVCGVVSSAEHLVSSLPSSARPLLQLVAAL